MLVLTTAYILRTETENATVVEGLPCSIKFDSESEVEDVRHGSSPYLYCSNVTIDTHRNHKSTQPYFANKTQHATRAELYKEHPTVSGPRSTIPIAIQPPPRYLPRQPQPQDGQDILALDASLQPHPPIPPSLDLDLTLTRPLVDQDPTASHRPTPFPLLSLPFLHIHIHIHPLLLRRCPHLAPHHLEHRKATTGRQARQTLPQQRPRRLRRQHPLAPGVRERGAETFLALIVDAAGDGLEVLDGLEEGVSLREGEEALGMVVKEGEGFGEEGEEAVDLDDDVAVRVVQAAVDGVGGAVDDGDEGGGGFAFAGEGPEAGFVAGDEVGFGVAQVVEAAEGGVAAQVEFEHLGGVGVDGGEGGEDFFG